MISGSVQCILCPFVCTLAPGERGRCGVRLNRDGELISLVYGRPVAVHVDPVEKKPLYHFHPGESVLSIATAGCNLRCLNCQNWEISQAFPEDVPPYNLMPEAVVEMALEHECGSIAYTYTEPVVFFEYVQDTARIAREKGLSNILVTAGYINEGPLRELAQFIDAANIDLKSMSEEFYNEVCGATLEPVQKCVSVLHEMGVWIEVTNLVIPTLNDSEEQTERLYNWVLDTVGPDVPLHFSRFFPMYRMVDLPPTPVGTLASARSRALESGLNHVYVGNVACEHGADTFCSHCGRRLIERQGYSVTTNSVRDGACTWCSNPVSGVWNIGGASNGGE